MDLRHAYDTIGLIYETATSPGKWRRALDGVIDAVDAKAAALTIEGKAAGAKDLVLMSSVFLDFSRSPSGLWYQLRHSRQMKPEFDFIRRQTALNLIRDTDTGRHPDELDQRLDYTYLRRKLGISRQVWMRLNSDAVWHDLISLSFPSMVQSVPPRSVETVSLLAPHMAKAVEMGRTFTMLKARYAAALAALDHVQAGMAIALPSGELLVENIEAKRILGLSEGIRKAPDGRIALHNPDLTSEIRAHIRTASNTARGEDNQAEMLVKIPRGLGQAPFLLEVAPISDRVAELGEALDGALITLIDPDRVPYLRLGRFAALYGMTQAESEICHLITEGSSVNEIAERRNTSPTTAKNQIASVLAKAGVSRRTELIRLILRVLPPVS